MKRELYRLSDLVETECQAWILRKVVEQVEMCHKEWTRFDWLTLSETLWDNGYMFDADGDMYELVSEDDMVVCGNCIYTKKG